MGNKILKTKRQHQKIDPKLLKELEEQSGFKNVELSELMDVFESVATKKDPVSRSQFDDAVKKLNNVINPVTSSRMFDMFDVNNDGTVDIREFICGLGLLCHGSADDKLRLCFRAADKDRNGVLSREEVAALFKQTWLGSVKAICSSNENILAHIDQEDLVNTAEALAEEFVATAFAKTDKDGDGKLSFEEFKYFALLDPKIQLSLAGKTKVTSLFFEPIVLSPRSTASVVDKPTNI